MRAWRDTTGGDRSGGGGAAALGAPGKRTLVEQAYAGAPVQAKPVGAAGPAGASPEEVIVTASALRVRSAPDTSSKVLGKLHDGDRVPTTGKAGAWLTTPYAGTLGYISGKYTKPATIVDDVTGWIASFLGGGDHDDPAAPVAPSLDPAGPAGPAAPEGPDAPITPKPTPAPGELPSGAAKLSDVALAGYLAGLHDPIADAAAGAVASCEAQAAELATHLDAHEETGAGRDALVASIAHARAQIGLLDGAGLDEVSRAYVKAALYAIVTRCAPYYSQGRNIDVLETKTDTRTCNLTSLAMALEALGKSANDYAGSRDEVLAVARYTPYAPRVNGKVAGGTGSFGKLAALRLPDFLQLAAIAECLHGGTSDAEIQAAAQLAWARIVKTFDIHLQIAARFGVAGQTKVLEGGLGGALGSIKKSARKEMQEVVDARNAAERSGAAHDQAAYADARDAHAAALTGDKIEGKVPLDEYRAAVITHIGGELASGASVFMLMAAHYARVQMVSDDHVIVDDPGRDFRSGQKVLWEEARAMGYFKKRIVLR